MTESDGDSSEILQSIHGVQHTIIMDTNLKRILIELEKLHVLVKILFTLVATVYMFIPEARLVWLTTLFLFPFLVLRIIFILTSRNMTLVRLEFVRALLYGVEAFTALILVILGYAVRLDVLPSADYF